LFIAVQEWSSDLQARAKLPPLKYAVADAELLIRAYRSLGVPQENISALVNQAASVPAISGRFAELADRVRPEDTVVVTFLGHGIGSTAQDSRLAAFDDLMSVSWLLERLDQLATRRVLLVIDACRSGNRGEPRFVIDRGNLERRNGLAWIASAMAEQAAFESEELGHGVFSYHFASVLEQADHFDANRNGWLDLDELGGSVREQVAEWATAARLEQTPTYESVFWQLSRDILPIPRRWRLVVHEPQHTTRLDITFPTGIPRENRVWLAVAPRSCGGQYWIQPHAVFRGSDGPEQHPVVYLGDPQRHVGETFRIIVIEADRTLDAEFRAARNNAPSITSLSELTPRIRAEETVERRR
jgi:hypothetical protein